jgi:hypothetical protein
MHSGPGGDCLASQCTAIASTGQRCKNNAEGDVCRFHSADPAERERVREQGRKGGKTKAYGNLANVPPIAETIDVDAIDLETAGGAKALLAATLRQLARLPFDVRVANSIAQVATAQRAVISESDIEARLAALEAAP